MWEQGMTSTCSWRTTANYQLQEGDYKYLYRVRLTLLYIYNIHCYQISPAEQGAVSLWELCWQDNRWVSTASHHPRITFIRILSTGRSAWRGGEQQEAKERHQAETRSNRHHYRYQTRDCCREIRVWQRMLWRRDLSSSTDCSELQWQWWQ